MGWEWNGTEWRGACMLNFGFGFRRRKLFTCMETWANMDKEGFNVDGSTACLSWD